MLLKPIRLRLQRLLLHKRLTNHEVHRKSVAIDHARHIGILFLATDPANSVTIRHFTRHWKEQEKRIELLGYIHGSHPEESVSYPYFCRKDVSWIYEPKGPAVDHFVKQPFDILLNAYTGDWAALDYIATFSQAHMRVGPYDRHKMQCCDMMVDLREVDPPLQALLNNFERYLKMIKTNE